MGVSDEVHQHFVPFRVMSFSDMIADSLGVLIGIFIFIHVGKFKIVSGGVEKHNLNVRS
jgi:VanZ family protein